MDNCIAPRPVPRALPAAAGVLAAAVTRAASWARRLDAWLARRARAAEDYELLAQMNERELQDIGLSRGWTRYAAQDTRDIHR